MSDKAARQHVHTATARLELRDAAYELLRLPEIVTLPPWLERNVRGLAQDLQWEADRLAKEQTDA